MRGKRALRHGLFQAALVVIKLARKLVTIASAMCKSRKMWEEKAV